MEKPSKTERERLVEKVKVQCVLSNYGLPENAEIIGLGNLSVDDARRRIPAIRELWVRLNLWSATGEYSSGHIAYPEARRRIEYHFTNNPDIVFKALCG